MGDVLLQKHLLHNSLEGKPQKNNGELPLILHRKQSLAVVTKEMFHQVQEEIARRKANALSLRNILKTNGENSPVNMYYLNGWYGKLGGVITCG